MLYIPLILALVGFTLLILGTVYPAYRLPYDLNNYLRSGRLCKLRGLIKRLEDLLAPSKNSKLDCTLRGVISKFDVDITVARFWFYKILCLLISFVILTMVSLTNSNIMKQDIMGSWWQENNILASLSPDEHKYNAELYKEVVFRIGEKNLKKLSDEERIRKITLVLQDGRSGSPGLNGKAMALLAAFQNSENVRIITVNLLIAAAMAFFLPEIILFVRKLIVGKKYKREAIKMENIFGLLGTIEDYKTVYIIKDMALASKVFSKQLNHAATIFYTDKNKCFEYLKESIKEKSFARLVDTMRVYSTVDRKVALSILERNLKEQEEQLLLSAEEDMDVVDILAFMSVIPILYEVANLMLKPMLEVVSQAFNFM